ncbi:MAG: MarR family transcriptional regulator [Olleya sp.]
MKIEDIIKTNKPLKLSKQVIINIIHSGIFVSFQLNKALKEFDITLQQFNVLRILRGQNGNCLNLSEIQERMINANSNTTRLIDKLVLKNYAKREIDSENRRKVSICITKTGLTFLKQLDDIIDRKEEEKIVSNLTKDECVLLNTLLEKIRT